jgi:hypothetical protein
LNFGQNGLVVLVVKKMEAAEKLPTTVIAKSEARGVNQACAAAHPGVRRKK